jgi:hypothetical protein
LPVKVAFILGAGASKEFGYPLGSELKKDILDKLNPKSTMFAGLLGAGNSADDVVEFKKSLFRADYGTIDQFVAAQHRHPEIQRIARQAIALSISSFENDDRLFGLPGAHWYKRLIDFLRNRPDLLKRDNLSFFTFNYDRSLEHYLHETVSRGGGGFSENFLREFFHGNFVHVHGTVGYLPWQTAPQGSVIRDYGATMDPNTVRNISHNLLTPDQEVTLSGELLGRIFEADVVVIMGFGFHQQNMDKIQFAKLATQEGKKVFVTVQALDTQKRDFLKSMRSVTVYENDCANFMMGFVENWAKTPGPSPRISGPRLPR